MPSLIPAYSGVMQHDGLYQEIDKQIEIVKHIKKLLDAEQRKLDELMNKITTTTTRNEVGFANEIRENAKRIRVCSPSSINRNLNSDQDEKLQSENDLTNKREGKEFKSFWSSNKNWLNLDDESKEVDRSAIDIEQIVEEEIRRLGPANNGSNIIEACDEKPVIYR